MTTVAGRIKRSVRHDLSILRLFKTLVIYVYHPKSAWFQSYAFCLSHAVVIFKIWNVQANTLIRF